MLKNNLVDVNLIRAQFPILDRKIHGKPLCFLDSAASSQMPTRVIQRIDAYHTNEHANIHRGVHSLSQEATTAYEHTRKRFAEFIQAPSEDEIIFTSGATDALNLLAYSYGMHFLEEGDEIILTEMEHHANIVPWQFVAEKKGANIRVIPINEIGELDLNVYQDLLNAKTKIVAVTHISNVLGTINPIAEMSEMAHNFDAVFVVDGCQAAAHNALNVKALDVDFYTFSSHKMYGPTGFGILWGRKELLEVMPPFKGGGDMINEVRFEKTTYNDLPHKFEAGTPPIVAGIASACAIDLIEEIGFDVIHTHEQSLLHYASDKLNQFEGVRIFGQSKDKAAVLSFNLADIHPHDLGTVLDQNGVAIRTGHHCAQPLIRKLGEQATARASFAVYNTYEEIDQFIDSLHLAKELFS